jgi:hypothetical protein
MLRDNNLTDGCRVCNRPEYFNVSCNWLFTVCMGENVGNCIESKCLYFSWTPFLKRTSCWALLLLLLDILKEIDETVWPFSNAGDYTTSCSRNVLVEQLDLLTRSGGPVFKSCTGASAFPTEFSWVFSVLSRKCRHGTSHCPITFLFIHLTLLSTNLRIIWRYIMRAIESFLK